MANFDEIKRIFTMNSKEKLLGRITVNPKTMIGKPTVRGTRLTVELLLNSMAAGRTFEELQSDYPFLEMEDLQACLFYASSLVAEEKIFPILAAA